MSNLSLDSKVLFEGLSLGRFKIRLGGRNFSSDATFVDLLAVVLAM